MFLLSFLPIQNLKSLTAFPLKDSILFWFALFLISPHSVPVNFYFIIEDSKFSISYLLLWNSKNSIKEDGWIMILFFFSSAMCRFFTFTLPSFTDSHRVIELVLSVWLAPLIWLGQLSLVDHRVRQVERVWPSAQPGQTRKNHLARWPSESIESPSFRNCVYFEHNWLYGPLGLLLVWHFIKTLIIYYGFYHNKFAWFIAIKHRGPKINGWDHLIQLLLHTPQIVGWTQPLPGILPLFLHPCGRHRRWDAFKEKFPSIF